jgi:hypothetical protein
LRYLRTTVVALGSLAVLGLGTSAWAAQASTSSHQAVAAASAVNVGSVPTRSSGGQPVWKPLLLSTNVAKAGQSIGLAGAGCSPGTSVFVSIGSADRSQWIRTVTADRAGAFKAHRQIPVGTQAGVTAVWAACKAPLPTGKQMSTASLTITG